MGLWPCIISKETIQTSEDAKITESILEALLQAIEKVPGLINMPWELRLVDYKGNEEEAGLPHCQLVITSVKGRGNTLAREKIWTLRCHDDISLTGDLKDQMVYPNLPKDQTSWHGGIRLRYFGYEPRENGEERVDGCILVAFSGAPEAVDLGIALETLEAYIGACEVYSDGTYDYHSNNLQRHALSGYLIRLLNLCI